MTESVSPKRELSLIFVNYRSVFNLSRALRSLEKDEFFRKDVEVIVINHDDTEEKAIMTLAEQYGFRLIKRENSGFASGANAGASVANGRYLTFLNPDTRYHLGSLRDGITAFQKKDRLGIVGAMLLSDGGIPEEWSRGRFLNLFQLIQQNILPKALSFRNESIDWVSGGAFFIKKELFQRLRGFDEGFFLYFEDMDLCRRARNEGYTAESCVSQQFLHQGGKSFSSRQVQKKYYEDSKRWYFKKHRPFWEQSLLSLLQRMKIW